MYRWFVYAVFGGGFLAGLVLAYLFLVRDRGPTRWSRAAQLVIGLIAVVLTSYGAGVLTLASGQPVREPASLAAWIAALVIRPLGVLWLWWLVYVYLTPDRDHHRTMSSTLGYEKRVAEITEDEST